MDNNQIKTKQENSKNKLNLTSRKKNQLNLCLGTFLEVVLKDGSQYTHTHTHTHKERDRKTGRQAGRQTERLEVREEGGRADRQMDEWKEREINIQMDRQTKR